MKWTSWFGGKSSSCTTGVSSYVCLPLVCDLYVAQPQAARRTLFIDCPEAAVTQTVRLHRFSQASGRVLPTPSLVQTSR